MMEKMMSTMMERMAAKLPPQEMRAMMTDMMGKMVADMPAAERLSFMRSMLGTCLPIMMDGMDAEARQQVMRQMADAVAGPAADPPHAS